jgi:glutathione gamma-glutamylcysteinyltransferase
VKRWRMGQWKAGLPSLSNIILKLSLHIVDPRRPWKGQWRWYSEEMLDCCVQLSEIRKNGISLDEMGCLARCNELTADIKHADRCNSLQLHADLLAASKGDGSVVIASYSREKLGQTGDGHFSPVGGIDASESNALILDVARFKYPPHWVAISQLFEAMQSRDGATQRSRGWIVMRRRDSGNGYLASLFCGNESWRQVVAAFVRPLANLNSEKIEMADVLRVISESVPLITKYIQWRVPTDDSHQISIIEMRQELRSSPVGQAVSAHTSELDDAALSLYVLAPRLGPLLNRSVAQQLHALADLATLSPVLAAEINYLRHQLDSLDQNCCVSQ